MSIGEIMRYAGAVALLASALLVIRSYRAHLGRRRREGSAFLELIERIYDMVELFLTPIKRIFLEYETDEQTVSDLVEDIRGGAAPNEAFAKVKGRLAIGREGKEILEKLFLGLGKGYKDGALSLIDGCKKRFIEYKNASEEDGEKSISVISALVLGGVAGVVLLFI